jgi:hypothetical protein
MDGTVSLPLHRWMALFPPSPALVPFPADGARLPGPLVLSSSSKSLSSQVLRVRLSNREDAARSSAARANFSDAHAVENNGHLYISCTLTTHNSNELAIFSIPPLQHVGMVFGEKRVTLSTIPEKFPPRDRAATNTSREWRPIGRQLSFQLAS